MHWVEVKRIADVPLPAKSTADAAGYDLCAKEGCTVPARSRLLVGTGLTMAIKPGFEGQIRPRSGLALKHGITVLNAPGTIDADYRGEVGVILFNSTNETFEVKKHERIAQIVFSAVPDVVLLDMEDRELSPTDSNRTGGYGSTGK